MPVVEGKRARPKPEDYKLKVQFVTTIVAGASRILEASSKDQDKLLAGAAQSGGGAAAAAIGAEVLSVCQLYNAVITNPVRPGNLCICLLCRIELAPAYRLRFVVQGVVCNQRLCSLTNAGGLRGRSSACW